MAGLAVAMLCDFIGPDRSTRVSVRRVAVWYVGGLLLTCCVSLAFLALRKDPPFIGLEERVLLVLAFVWLALK